MTGTVVRCTGALALVEQREKESPCDMCKSPCIQKNCSKTKKISLWAKNPVCAKVGDRVETVELKNSSSLLFGILCFVLPIAVSALCFAVTSELSEGFRVLSAFVCFALCEAVSALICSVLSKRLPALEITDVL